LTLPLGDFNQSVSPRGVWAKAPNDVYIDGDWLLHWDGTTLSKAGPGSGSDTGAIIGLSSGELWTAGEQLLRYNPTGDRTNTWEVEKGLSTRSTTELTGFAATEHDAWLVGPDGEILHRHF
jgi:hypothetical protein